MQAVPLIRPLRLAYQCRSCAAARAYSPEEVLSLAPV